MHSAHFHATCLLAALAIVGAYDEKKQFLCVGYTNYILGKQVCNGYNDCTLTSYERSITGKSSDESDSLCAPNDIKSATLDLNILTHPNGSLLLSWRWGSGATPRTHSGYFLAGYYLHGTSPEHTFQITLSPLLTSYSADHLRGYTMYEFTLRPFYKVYTTPNAAVYLGKPTTHHAKTPACAPGAPTAIVALPPTSGQGHGQLQLTIHSPIAWNSKPLGYLVRWEPAERFEVSWRNFDFPNVTSGAARTTYDHNVSLSLKPGLECTVFASARGIGDFGEEVVSTETSTVVGTAPLAPSGLSAQVADATKVILAWSVGSPAARFEMNVTQQQMTQQDEFDGTSLTKKLQSGIGPSSQSPRLQNMTFSLDGSIRESSAYRLPVLGLMPSSQYSVRVRACAAKACSKETSTVFRTPHSGIPRIVITSIFSNDSRSVHLEWNFTLPQGAPDYSAEFEVKLKKDGYYRLVRTVEKKLTITNLTSGTQYEVEVQPSLEIHPGKRQHGHATAATISTWPLVPLAPTLSLDGFESAPELVAVSWTFFNSTVTHVEVATNYSNWAKCDGTSNCDFIVRHGWNSSFKTGFVRISALDPYETYAIAVKGCNQHGCGEPTRVVVSTAVSEPSEPLELALNVTKSVLGYLTWEAPQKPAGPITGYIVSWLCENGDLMAASTSDTYLVVPGLPIDSQECTFSVAAYNAAKAGTELRGDEAILTTVWPII